MAKFNKTATRPAVGESPIATEAQPSGSTHEGAPGFARDPKGELFLLAASNIVGEASFYEGAGDRDARYAALVHQVAVADAGWMLGFLRWLRGDGNMRSASLVGAVEAVKARLCPGPPHSGHASSDWTCALEDGVKRSGIKNRQLVNAVLQRADEPGEMLAYWTSRYGKPIPQPIKRGIGDAVIRLGTEFNYVKWDSEGNGFRFADILNLTHPGDRKGSAQHIAGPWQHDLFGYVVKRPYQPDIPIPERLELLNRRDALLLMPVDERRRVLEDPELLRRAGITWEALAGWLQGPMDRAAWEAIIPSMGYMALLRNLRNFDQAGVSDELAATVAARLADPEQVARSRQFPFRFLAAYRNAPSLRWGHALDQALTHSLANVPELSGRTLVLVDRSGSMFGRMSGRSELTFADSAAIFGAALAMRNLGRVTLVQYGNSSGEVAVGRGESLLKVLDRFGNLGGTQTAAAVQRHYDRHDRVVIVTDEQAWAGYGTPGQHVPAQVPVITFNLVGYRYGHQGDSPNRITVGGGLTDHAFRLIPLLEQGASGAWPWVEQPAD